MHLQEERGERGSARSMTLLEGVVDMGHRFILRRPSFHVRAMAKLGRVPICSLASMFSIPIQSNSDGQVGGQVNLKFGGSTRRISGQLRGELEDRWGELEDRSTRLGRILLRS